MKAAAIGLMIEGKQTVNSFLKRGWEVYASDLNYNLDLNGLNIPLGALDLADNDNSMSICGDNFRIDVGYRDPNFIYDNDVIAFDDEMWGSPVAVEIITSGKFLPNKFNKHKDVFTIGICGIQGKEITIAMLNDICENAGLKTLVTDLDNLGYYDFILEANFNEYDVLIVDVDIDCFDFCNYIFNFDIIGLTNMDNNTYQFLEVTYRLESLLTLITNKELFLAEQQIYREDLVNYSKEYYLYDEWNSDSTVTGSFNRLNAGLASSIAFKMDISKNVIESTLKDFKAPMGSLNVYKINDVDIYVGLTENSETLSNILNERNFYALFLGMPEFNNDLKLNLLNSVLEYNPEVVVLFPGVDDSVDNGLYKLQSLGYNGRIEIVYSLDELIVFVAEFSHEEAILIGGFGKESISQIEERISLLSKNCS